MYRGEVGSGRHPWGEERWAAYGVDKMWIVEERRSEKSKVAVGLW
jgi:hypothetical protein